MTDEESRLEAAIDELYAADLDQFTPRRTELAKAARAAGDKDVAKAISALRKPTQSAFTMNRLARTDPSAIVGLIDIGAELRRAQRSADGKQLRELNAQRRSLLDSLTRRAFEIIGQQSPSSGQREEVNATLTAALADPTVAGQLQQGVLVQAAESSGFGFSPPELTLIRNPVKRPEVSSNPAPTPVEKAVADRKSTETEEAIRKAAVGRQAETDRRRANRERRDALLTKAQYEAEAADEAVNTAMAAIEADQQLIRVLQHRLNEARRRLEEDAKHAKLAETRQRRAREALNKAKG